MEDDERKQVESMLQMDRVQWLQYLRSEEEKQKDRNMTLILAGEGEIG